MYMYIRSMNLESSQSGQRYHQEHWNSLLKVHREKHGKQYLLRYHQYW